MTIDPPEPHYSIAAVSKLTGVSCHTLRVWERRYGFPEPLRTPSGHRRYAAEQVNLICEVARRSRAGGSIARLVTEARDGRIEVEPGIAPGPGRDGATGELVEALIRADLIAAEAAYRRTAAGLSPAEVADRIITPALTESGERLFRRTCALYQERLSTMFLLRKLAALVDEAQRANTEPIGKVIAIVLEGDRHEGGALMLSLALELAGWRAIFLGADVPVREIQRSIDDWNPAAVGVSLTLSRNIRKRFNELAGLRGAPVFVGGRSVVNYQGLARRSGLNVVLGPAIPSIGRFLHDVNPDAREAPAAFDASSCEPARSLNGNH